MQILRKPGDMIPMPRLSALSMTSKIRSYDPVARREKKRDVALPDLGGACEAMELVNVLACICRRWEDITRIKGGLDVDERSESMYFMAT